MEYKTYVVVPHHFRCLVTAPDAKPTDENRSDDPDAAAQGPEQPDAVVEVEKNDFLIELKSQLQCSLQ